MGIPASTPVLAPPGGRRTRAAFLALGLIAVGAMAWASRSELIAVLSGLAMEWFVGSIVLGLVLALVQGVIFHRLLSKYRAIGHPRQSVGAFLVSQPARYVPGKVWSPIVQSGVLGRGAPLAATAAANIELALLVVLQLTALGFACLWVQRPALAAGMAVLGVVASGLVLALPTGAILARWLPRLAGWLRIEAGTSERRSSLGGAFAMTAASMALNLTASWMLVVATGPAVSSAIHVPLLAVFYLGFAASMFAVPFPAGLGVREAATVGAAALVAGQIPAAMVVSVALLARCWQLILDGLCMLAGYGLLVVRPATRK